MPHKTLTPEIESVLKRADIKGNQLVVPNNPDGSRLDRKLYTDVNALLTNLGGKWNKKLKAHVFDGDVKEKLKEVFDTGVSRDKKKDLQAFYTPKELAEYIANIAGVNGESVLEPSAGAGALALACREAGAKTVRCIEIDEKAGAQLKEFAFDTTVGDFLEIAVDKQYSRVVMNPPFSRNTYIAHIVHAVDWVKEGGRLVSIIPGGIRNPKLETALGDYDFSIEPLDEKSFKESGTLINTSVLIVEL
jgi:16S rRNA G966 N2-methylase RsmD